MSDEDYKDVPLSKVAMRGKMLVAWLAEATPPVLWRWRAGDGSSGFGLQPKPDGKVELLRFDGGVTPQIIASFTSAESAERALNQIARALLSFQAPVKRAFKLFGTVIILLFLIAVFTLLYRLFEIRSATSMLSKLQASALHAPVSKPGSTAGSSGLLLPGQAPESKPTAAPVDVDSLYH